jgi:hypothetical protein
VSSVGGMDAAVTGTRIAGHRRPVVKASRRPGADRTSVYMVRIWNMFSLQVVVYHPLLVECEESGLVPSVDGWLSEWGGTNRA